MPEALNVWIGATCVARVEQVRKKLRLTYTDEALQLYPLGSPVLSLSLPLTSVPYPQGVVRAFLDGLLPEGEARRIVAEEFELVSSDTFGLVEAIGRDCAGAIVIQPEDEPAPDIPHTSKATPLDEAEMAELVNNLASAPLGVDANVRVSLAGLQEKLVLTRRPDGAWGRPVGGAPSTHILKPEHPSFPNTVENEAFCMYFADRLGLDVAKVETYAVSNRRLLVVERYDRVVSASGRVERVHQEDFCQALGILPSRKYEEDGGPALRDLARVLADWVGAEAIETLLRGLIVNLLIGNGDAHAKNFSLLHTADGGIRLAPFYDLLSTIPYGDNRLAMYVDSVQRFDRVSSKRVLNEAVSWGIEQLRASDILQEMLSAAERAAEGAREQVKDVPDNQLAIVRKQLARLSPTRA